MYTEEFTNFSMGNEKTILVAVRKKSSLSIVFTSTFVILPVRKGCVIYELAKRKKSFVQ